MKKIMLCGFILLCLALLLPHEASAVETSGTCGSPERVPWTIGPAERSRLGKNCLTGLRSL